MIKWHLPDWTDLQLSLDALTETGKQLILKEARDLAEGDCRIAQSRLRDVFPLLDPYWDPNNDSDVEKLENCQNI